MYIYVYILYVYIYIYILNVYIYIYNFYINIFTCIHTYILIGHVDTIADVEKR